MLSHRPSQTASVASLVLVSTLLPAVSVSAGDPYADHVVAFDPGLGGADGYDNPLTTLGSPERYTGEGIFPGVVSPFNPAFGTDELISLGAGGFITLQFDTPVTNDPGNPYGIDLLLFGNSGFIDSNFPSGVVGGLFGNDGGMVEVSADGIEWIIVNGVSADGMFPTIGYLDAGPYDPKPGAVLADFTRPINPDLGIGDFLGLGYEDVLDLYDGSGGGTGVDIGSLGLSAISFVRISNPSDATLNVELDALADVAAIPGPGGLLVLTGLPFVVNGRPRRRPRSPGAAIRVIGTAT